MSGQKSSQRDDDVGRTNTFVIELRRYVVGGVDVDFLEGFEHDWMCRLPGVASCRPCFVPSIHRLMEEPLRHYGAALVSDTDKQNVQRMSSSLMQRPADRCEIGSDSLAWPDAALRCSIH
jgi:hypothetical protein